MGAFFGRLLRDEEGVCLVWSWDGHAACVSGLGSYLTLPYLTYTVRKENRRKWSAAGWEVGRLSR